MKLAEALSVRKDLQTRLDQLRSRLSNNVKVQEGDEPAEEPEQLLKEVESILNELGVLIYRINRTNLHTVKDGKSLTEMMAEREVLGYRLHILNETFERATQSTDRYGRQEIKYVTTVDVAELRAKIDHNAKMRRELDYEIQALNFATELE